MVVMMSWGVFYISMNLFWLLLGAIINPNQYLLYATSVCTLLTFVSAKRKQINNILDNLTNQI